MPHAVDAAIEQLWSRALPACVPADSQSVDSQSVDRQSAERHGVDSAIEQLWGPVASEGRVDGRRHNRGRKARRSWLVKEKLRWIERVKVELGGSTAREDIGPAVRRALEAHDYPYIEGDAGRVCGKKRGGQHHYQMWKAVYDWYQVRFRLRAQAKLQNLCRVRSSVALTERVRYADAEKKLDAEVRERWDRSRLITSRWLSMRMRQLVRKHHDGAVFAANREWHCCGSHHMRWQHCCSCSSCQQRCC